MSVVESERAFSAAVIDFSALSGQVSNTELSHFRTQPGRVEVPADTASTARAIIRLVLNVVVLLVCLGAPLAFLAFVTDELSPKYSTEPGMGIVWAATVLLGSIPAAFVVNDVHAHVRLRWPWRRWLRLSRFAVDNGLQYLPESPAPSLPGVIFAGSPNRVATDRLMADQESRFEIGNFETARGEITFRTARWGYMALRLDRTLPHMVLHAVANRRRKRTLPGAILSFQALSLEGDFDQHFTLHAPRRYERDALYVFSPDLMALMVDEARTFEIEIVDNWIIFYKPNGFDLSSEQTARTLFRIASIVGAKTSRQTRRYWDIHGGTFVQNVVAADAERLRVRRVLSGAAVLLIVLLVAQFLKLVS